VTNGLQRVIDRPDFKGAPAANGKLTLKAVELFAYPLCEHLSQ